MAIIPYKDIAGKLFATDGPILEAAANEARRAFCQNEPIGTTVLDTGITLSGPLKAVQESFVRYVCELPDDPVPLAPPILQPSNDGICECRPYRVSYQLRVDGQPFGGSFTDRLGPISTYIENSPGPGGATLTTVGITHRGGVGGTCSTSVQKFAALQVEAPSFPEIILTSIVPAPDYPSLPCERPTYPIDRPRSPSDRNPPTINFPVPNLPSINIPVIPVPVVVPVGVLFSPRFVLDVGGVNFEFSLGGVEINVNTSNQSSPVTIVQPGFKQPSLPPSVTTITFPGGGDDCCDEILDKLDDIEETLKDIEECACANDGEEFMSFTDVQTYTINTGSRAIVNVDLSVLSIDVRKAFNVIGGKEVTFVGWYAFGVNGRMGRRHGIQYKSTRCFPDEKLYNEFTFSLYNGLRADGKVYVEKEEGV